MRSTSAPRFAVSLACRPHRSLALSGDKKTAGCYCAQHHWGSGVANRVADDVLRLLDVADHATTPDAIRRHLPELRVQAEVAPSRVMEQLKLRSRPVLDALPMATPSATLYRVQQLEVFFEHCTADVWRALDVVSFARLVESDPDPDSVLTQALARDRTVFPAEHSWMVAADRSILQATGAQLRSMLRLGLQEPPFALCVLPVASLSQAGVTVRSPTGADAALGGHDYWRPAELPAGIEYVDLDIPGSAVEEVLWRP